MPLAVTPSAGSQVTASAQLLRQQQQVLTTETFASGVSASDTFARVSALTAIRVQLFLYPQYERGLATFLARNYIQWRIMGLLPPQVPKPYTNLIPTGDGGRGDAVPLTTPQLLPVGQPIDYQIPVGGAQFVYIDFDTTSGTAGVNQGRDLVMVAITAGG